jgi:hypothetical protein
MKNVKYLLIMFVIFMLGTINVNAEGTAIASVNGNNIIKVGDEVTYNIVISDMKNYDTGITGIQGIINYDSNLFTYVSSKPMSLPIDVQEYSSVAGVYHIAGYALDEGFKTNKVVYSITLKAIKEGKTSIKLDEFYLSDLAANLITCNMINQSIEIKSAEVKENKTENNNVTKNSETIVAKNNSSNSNVNTNINKNTSSILDNSTTNESTSKTENEEIQENENDNNESESVDNNISTNETNKLNLNILFNNIINLLKDIFSI